MLMRYISRVLLCGFLTLICSGAALAESDLDIVDDDIEDNELISADSGEWGFVSIGDYYVPAQCNCAGTNPQGGCTPAKCDTREDCGNPAICKWVLD